MANTALCIASSGSAVIKTETTCTSIWITKLTLSLHCGVCGTVVAAMSTPGGFYFLIIRYILSNNVTVGSMELACWLDRILSLDGTTRMEAA